MKAFEHIDLDIRWKETLKMIALSFGEVEDLKDVVFLIGVQELGLGFQKFSKDEKIDVMHIGVCKLLSQYGYYEYRGRDTQGWPHFERIKAMPKISESERELLLKDAVVTYFESAD